MSCTADRSISKLFTIFIVLLCKFDSNSNSNSRYSWENMIVFCLALDFHTTVYIFKKMRGAPRILVPFKIIFDQNYIN